MRNGVCRAISASIAVAALALLAPTSAPDAEAAAERDRYIIVFEDSVEHPANLAHAQVEQRSGKLGFIYRVVLNGYSAELPAQAVEGLRRDPRVKYVVVDGEVEPLAQTTPTGISRTFATANKALDIDSVDDIRVDADIAVIDTGVDHTHPDLNVVARTDCSNGTEKEAKCVESSGTDTHGHGTHVAGIAGAIDNGFGVVGTAPGARIWAVKVLETGTNWTSEIVAGVEWVTAKRKDGNPENDIEVVNMSLGCPVNPLCPTAPMDEAITKSVEAGVVVVVAAGNVKGGGADAKNYTPANSPSAITVSALADVDGQAGGKKGATTCTDDFPGAHELWSLTDDTKASFSNYGATVEIAAPGLCILSTYPGNEYKKVSGTSMAAPHVAGAAAMLAAHNPPKAKADVEEITKTLKNEGNTGWTDTSPDGIKEPLLDVSDESIFSLRWALQQPLNPGSDRLLFDVACDQTATGDCTAVGRYTNAGVATPLVQRFTEGSWSLQTAAKPAEATHTALDGVACPSESSCIAVGGYETKGTSVRTLADHWNGSSWSVVSTPNPAGTTASFLAGVGCSSTSACTAVGYAVVSGVRGPIAERWNGSTWTLQSVPVPAGATSSELYAVDCSSSSFCMGVGFYINGSGKTRGFTAVWEGTSWSLKGIVEPGETVESSLHDVSCVGSPAVCTAVGAWQPGASNQYNLVERWKEGSWSLQASPSNGQASVLQSVWCRTSSSCTAVGNSRSTVSSPIKTLALQWTGTEWLIEPTPNPSEATFGALVGVSCQAPTDTCRAVGWYTESGVNKALGEVRLGP
jgi:hypothetical protein